LGFDQYGNPIQDPNNPGGNQANDLDSVVERITPAFCIAVYCFSTPRGDSQPIRAQDPLGDRFSTILKKLRIRLGQNAWDNMFYRLTLNDQYYWSNGNMAPDEVPKFLEQNYLR
jgi:hypothetical protein